MKIASPSCRQEEPEKKNPSSFQWSEMMSGQKFDFFSTLRDEMSVQNPFLSTCLDVVIEGGKGEKTEAIFALQKSNHLCISEKKRGMIVFSGGLIGLSSKRHSSEAGKQSGRFSTHSHSQEDWSFLVWSLLHFCLTNLPWLAIFETQRGCNTRI